MKLILAAILAAFAVVATAGEPCSRYEGTSLKSCRTSEAFPQGDPVPATTDEGLGGNSGGGDK